MKYFFGCTFMSRDELEAIGVKYPIKLEYYKTSTNDEEWTKETTYGIEVIKTSYQEEQVNIEKQMIPEIMKDERKIEQILEQLKQHKVTPISAEYVIQDLLKGEC